MPKYKRELFYSAIKMVSYNISENREHLILIPEQMSIESPIPYPGNSIRVSGVQEEHVQLG